MLYEVITLLLKIHEREAPGGKGGPVLREPLSRRVTLRVRCGNRGKILHRNLLPPAQDSYNFV